ncbi:phosphotransferase [Candidatus Pelagibacter communis]|uniref:phosphotransferase n=1 Tax=Candidatus Pelagibacter TaxID=198251 RepID=UPI003EDFD62A
MNFSKKFKRLKGDASSRIFYRKKYNKVSSIIVYSKKDKKSNLLVYDSINKILIKNKITAPQLLSQNYSKNFIEIQDFGNETIFNLFKNKRINKINIYKKIVNLLNRIQSISQKKVINFQNQIYKVPKYTHQILEQEAKLFTEWYIKNKIKKSEQKKFKNSFNKIIKILIKKIHFKNDTFVHRDFHISNLMVVKNDIGVIDSQDALIGNKTYDLASLIDDVRFQTSVALKNKIYNFYLKTQKKLNKKYFKNDFEIISVLRNLKIIGIFTRLAVRDNKKKYLQLIPYTWKLIKLRSQNDNFKDLNNLLKVLEKKK